MSILVALDLSVDRDAVLEVAKDLARGRSDSLWLIHVAAPDPDFVGYAVGPDAERHAVAEHLRHEHEALQAHASALRGAGFDATAIMLQGPTVETILERADHFGAEWIVVGSHGKGPLSRALLGSVSHGVIKDARCPVVVVPPAVARD